MKNFKSIMKTVLFSTFLSIVLLTSKNTVNLDINITEDSGITCCEEFPSLDSNNFID